MNTSTKQEIICSFFCDKTNFANSLSNLPQTWKRGVWGYTYNPWTLEKSPWTLGIFGIPEISHSHCSTLCYAQPLRVRSQCCCDINKIHEKIRTCVFHLNIIFGFGRFKSVGYVTFCQESRDLGCGARMWWSGCLEVQNKPNWSAQLGCGLF